MYIIKFKAYGGMYELVLPQCTLYYNGKADSTTLKIAEIIKSIADSHFQQKIDRHLIEDLRDEIKEQIENQGYKFEFIEQPPRSGIMNFKVKRVRDCYYNGQLKIKTLEELIEYCKSNGNKVILDTEDGLKLEIYDTYRE